MSMYEVRVYDKDKKLIHSDYYECIDKRGSVMVLDDKKNILKPISKFDDPDIPTKEILKQVYEALEEKGYNPINQIVGYVLSEDPTYITNYNNARGLIRRIDRDKLLGELVRSYLGIDEQQSESN